MTQVSHPQIAVKQVILRGVNDIFLRKNPIKIFFMNLKLTFSKEEAFHYKALMHTRLHEKEAIVRLLGRL